MKSATILFLNGISTVSVNSFIHPFIHPSIHPSIHSSIHFTSTIILTWTRWNLRLARRAIQLQVCPLDHCCSGLVFNFVFLLESQSNSYLKLPSVICTSTPIPTSRSPNLVRTPGPRVVRRNAVVVGVTFSNSVPIFSAYQTTYIWQHTLLRLASFVVLTAAPMKNVCSWQ